jgi:polyferredoxin
MTNPTNKLNTEKKINRSYIILFIVSFLLFLWPFLNSKIRDSIKFIYYFYFISWFVIIYFLYVIVNMKKSGDNND